MTRVHYSTSKPRWRQRVAAFCGSITHSSTPQTYVHETTRIEGVTCKLCLARLKREAKK